MSTKKQPKKVVESESESESESEEELDIINNDEGVIDEDEDDDNGEKDYGDYVEGEGDEVASNTELQENGDKDEVECYFEYDNVIDEFADLGPPVRVPDDERITLNKLTKYEMVRILGIRAQQIASNAPTLVKNIEGKSPVQIAIFELQNKMMPFIIRRNLPNNTYELWKIKELDVNLPDNEVQDLTNSFN